jgi:hypothetical protein
MNSEYPENMPVPQQGGDSLGSRPATVVVRGEMVVDPSAKPPSKDSAGKNPEILVPKKVSEAKAKMKDRLPALDDDDDMGVKKEQVVVRDGKADLAFTGTLLASVAPSASPNGRWKEYRVYETSAGRHVFSKITRRVFAEEHDDHEAEVFDPAPASVSAQLLRSAHELTHSRPKTWMDAAVHFFGYDPLAKALYRKLGGQFEEHIG